MQLLSLLFGNTYHHTNLHSVLAEHLLVSLAIIVLTLVIGLHKKAPQIDLVPRRIVQDYSENKG